MKPWILQKDALTGAQQRILQRSRPVIATAAYNDFFYEPYVNSLFRTVRLAQRYGIELEYISLGGGFYIEHARNKIAAVFLGKPDATHLIFVDADIGWEPERLFDLILADKDVIGGSYPRKKLPIQQTHQTMGAIVDKEEPTEAEHVPAGFLAIKRNILEKLFSKFPERKCSELNDYPFEYFQNPVRNGRRYGEDVNFCREVREMGEKVYLAPWINLIHIGNYRFQEKL